MDAVSYVCKIYFTILKFCSVTTVLPFGMLLSNYTNILDQSFSSNLKSKLSMTLQLIS